jgi:hypothetical protein
MIILRQRMRSKSERTDDVLAALAAIIPGARATQGVISLDIARDLLDPIRSSRPESTRTARRSNVRSQLPRSTGRWRCFPRRWRRRPIERSTTRRATRRSSELIYGVYGLRKIQRGVIRWIP